MKNLKLAMRESEQRTIIKISDIEIGRGFTVIAGPCSVESEEQIVSTAKAVKAAGATALRGGAFKPRTSPYSFQGLGAACLPWVFELAGKYDIRVIAMEVTHESHIEEIDAALEATGDQYARQGYIELAIQQYDNALRQENISPSTKQRLETAKDELKKVMRQYKDQL